jgi:hypothetical protein
MDSLVWRFSPMRFRLAVGSAVAFTLVALLYVGEARAAAEVHRFNLVLSAVPTQVKGGDFNESIDAYNQIALLPYGLEAVKHINFTWAYDAELRYFVRPSFAVAAGISQILAQQKQEFLPAIAQSTNIRARVLTVPIHVGGAYYLQPYNQGDFQARAFLGGGIMQYTYTRASFEQLVVSPDVPPSASFKYSLTNDSPGFYVEGGAHMFFAARWSVILSAEYRSGKLRNMQLDQLQSGGQDLPLPQGVFQNVHGKPFALDVSGVGVRVAAAFGL